MTPTPRSWSASAIKVNASSSVRRARLVCRLPQLLSVVLCLLCALLACSGAALAETVRVSATADAGLSPTQARQQALERALLEAVCREAKAMLPSSAADARLNALREHLAPHALDYVQSYHEAAAPKPAPEAAPQQGNQPGQQAQPAQAAQKPQDKNAPFEMELEVEVNRVYLRQTLIRLGFFAGAQHPGGFVLRLGPGVSEKDAKSFDQANALLGLSRVAGQAAALPEVALERLPQGYYKALLRQNAPAGQRAIAADSSDLAALWLDVWGRYFALLEQQSGPGMQRLIIGGFSGVDAVLEFYQALSAWDDALQDAKLAVVSFEPGGMQAQITCRVTSQERLDARLRDALPGRKLNKISQTGMNAR